MQDSSFVTLFRNAFRGHGCGNLSPPSSATTHPRLGSDTAALYHNNQQMIYARTVPQNAQITSSVAGLLHATENLKRVFHKIFKL